MSEELWPLPADWRWKKAAEIAEIVGGGTPPASDESNFDDAGVPWITPADLTGYEDTYIARGRRSLSEKGLASCGARVLPAGTVLYSSRAPIGYCAIASNPISTNQGFKSLVLHDGSVPEFVRYYLLASKEYAESLASGTTFKELSGSRMAEMLVPVAPEKKQRCIVAKLDSLFKRSQSAREELARIPRLVERYKQAILVAAFRGDLTKQWRNDRFGTTKLCGWTRRQMSDIAEVASGQTPKGIDHHLTELGEVPWFKVSSMNSPDNQEYLTHSEFRIPESVANHLGLKRFPVGTIVFPKRGGAIATNKKRKLGVVAGLDLNLMAVTPRATLPEFLWWWFQGIDLATLSNGSNVPQINHGDIEPLVVPIPSSEEQEEIVRYLKQKLDGISGVGSEVTHSTELLDRLDLATLAKAFRGELMVESTAHISCP